jgi:PAS domain S-box-containing protein
LCEEVHGLNERYVDLFMSAPIAYLVLDSQARIVSANLAAAELLGVEHALLHDLKISTFIEPELSESFVRHMRAVLRSDGTHKAELSLKVSDGEYREVRFESTRDPRRPQEWRAAVIDLSDVRRLERELERARSLEAIGTFAAGVAHDFGNLLNLIAMGVDLSLQSDVQPDQAKQPLVRIQRAVREGRRMVRQLLRYSSDREREREDATDIPVDAAVSDMEPELRRLCGKNITVRILLDAPDAHVRLDLGAPEEILLNLAANALHAMPSGGTLTIATSVCVEPPQVEHAKPGQSFVLLRVADNGRGMEPETRKRAFEPFFTTRRGAGTGLGLPMVSRIVTRAGGRVLLDSEPGRGTTFSIYLPVSDPGTAAHPAHPTH